MKNRRRRRNPHCSLSVTTHIAGKNGNNGEKMKVGVVIPTLIDKLTLQTGTLTSRTYAAEICMGVEIPSNLKDGVDQFHSTNSISDGISSSESCSASVSESWWPSTSESSPGSQDGSLCSATRHRNKQKRVIAVAGSVSNLLGKDYVKRVDVSIEKGIVGELERKGLEERMFSMFGSNGGISMETIQDVLYQCKWDVDKTLDCLLELTGSSWNCISDETYPEDLLLEANEWEDDAHESNKVLDDHLQQLTGSGCTRSYFQALMGIHSDNGLQNEPILPLDVLETLFTFQKKSGNCSKAMKWKDVVKRMQSLRGCSQDGRPNSDTLRGQEHHVSIDDEYHKCRGTSNHLWELVKSNYARASEEYSKGRKDYASYLADNGRKQKRRALKADEKASQDIFQARNRDVQNWLTIDLHGQHVNYAMKLLKLHLLFGAQAESVKKLRVITGCGSHGLGKSKLKQSISQFLDNEGIKWTEENRGTLLVRLDGVKEFNFVDSDSDGD